MSSIASLYLLTQYDFMRNAFLAGTIVAVLAGVVGYFVVLKRLSFTSHALSHIGFAGACGAGLVGLSLMMGQLALTVMAAILMVALGERTQRNENSIGVILAFSLGLGSLFLYLYNHYAGSINRILFGSLISVSDTDLKQMGVLSALSIVAIFALARPLWVSALLPELSAARGLPIRRLQYGFFILLAIAITLTSQAVGILLVFTLLIGPPAIAIKCSQGFWSGMGLSVLLNLLIMWVGLVVSALTNWPLSFWISGIVLGCYLMGLLGERSWTFPRWFS